MIFESLFGGNEYLHENYHYLSKNKLGEMIPTLTEQVNHLSKEIAKLTQQVNGLIRIITNETQKEAHDMQISQQQIDRLTSEVSDDSAAILNAATRTKAIQDNLTTVSAEVDTLKQQLADAGTAFDSSALDKALTDAKTAADGIAAPDVVVPPTGTGTIPTPPTGTNPTGTGDGFGTTSTSPTGASGSQTAPSSTPSGASGTASDGSGSATESGGTPDGSGTATVGTKAAD